jgi:hypothetical protein
MKFLISLIMFSAITAAVSAAEGVLCEGIDCRPVQLEAPVRSGSGLINLRGDAKRKLEGSKVESQNDNFLFAGDVKNEEAMDLKFNEIKPGTCLIDPSNGKTYYKVLSANPSNTMIRYVVENERHQYMLRHQNVMYKLVDQSVAFRKLRRYPCERTPNLHNDQYVQSCAKANTSIVGDWYCNPPRRFGK